MTYTYGVTLITGPRCRRKRMLATSLNSICGGSVAHIHVGEMLGRHFQHQTPIGRRLKRVAGDEMRHYREQPMELVLEAVQDWITKALEHQNAEHIVLSGSPSSEPEAMIWEKLITNLCVVNVKTTREHVAKEISVYPNGYADLEAAAEMVWTEYETEILPAFAQVRCAKILVNQDDPVLVNVQQIVRAMHLEKSHKQRLMDHLGDRQHRLHKMLSGVHDGCE